MANAMLNIDLGELPGEPEGLYALAHLANVACGGHAGDRDTVREAIARCLRHGTQLGAHPSYPDRANFGRVSVAMAPEALRKSVASQCALLAVAAREAGASVAFAKPHGALYHDANKDPLLARAVVLGVRDALGESVRIVGPPSGELARASGGFYLREGFADRAMRADGTLVPRSEPGALIEDPREARAQCERLLRSGGVDTVCVHGDTRGALAIAQAVREALDAPAKESTPT